MTPDATNFVKTDIISLIIDLIKFKSSSSKRPFGLGRRWINIPLEIGDVVICPRPKLKADLANLC